MINLIFFYPAQAGIRCKNDIISEGDTSSEVKIKLMACGTVLDKEIVSRETVVKKKTDKTVKKEKVTEIWYIRVKERGGMYCYPLSFEEGVLQRIGNWSRCD
ncbi:MAG: DUF2845 domain-containing protein [Desulfobacterales bacterium]|nr:DUF2845 domain-containing protein [Desulfobacterales bacterium]